ncbi:hypothetical protein ACTRXD_17455 [Nitrospira sp. T9]|uniref:hypothetical protein n=1 Tax=unclassified Nitrospira TaxID=2652172 RepID=UPI003F964239
MMGSLITFLNLWLKESQKQNLKEWISRASQKHLATPDGAVKIPLVLVFSLLQTFLGEKTLIKLSISKSITLSLFILLGSLGLVGFLTETTFGLKAMPWKVYDEELILLQESFSTVNKKALEVSSTERMEAIDTINKIVISAAEPQFKWIYLISLLAIITFSNLIGDIVSLKFNWNILKAIQSTDSPILILGSLLLSLLTSILISFTVFLICNLVSNIIFILTTVLALTLSLLNLGQFWTYSLFLTNLGVALFSSSHWVIAVAISSVLPSAILIVPAIMALVLSPWSKQINAILKAVVERSLLHKKGPILFIAAIVGCITAFLGALINLFTSP